MGKSKIQWTETTWNPLTGCDKVSAGCKNCYAATLAKRLQTMENPRYSNGFKLTLQPDKLQEPLGWKTPKRVFVNSMSDLFHRDVPVEFIESVFKTMNEAHWHTFQVLTKRHERLLELSPGLPWAENIWQGVSVENQDHIHRIDFLRQTSARVKFLSVEPLLGPLPHLNLEGIDWVIVGGESGHGFRPIDEGWVREIRDQCIAADVPFFFKQWAGQRPKRLGRLLDGREWNEYPRTSENVMNTLDHAIDSQTLTIR